MAPSLPSHCFHPPPSVPLFSLSSLPPLFRPYLPPPQLLDLRSFPFNVHVYRLYEEGPLLEELDPEEEDCASNNWTLPASQ